MSIKNKTVTIALASDHAGFLLKEYIKKYIITKQIEVSDLGTNSEESVDYPDFGELIAFDILNGSANKGIALCGTGIGISIAANRYKGIRAALCSEPKVVEIARRHNDANILVLGARLIDRNTACSCIDAFLNTPFDGGRHARRTKKLD